MKSKNILICLERLDIGGIETYVLNQATKFLKLGNKVIILADEGIYTKELEKRGAICKKIKFELVDDFSIEKTQEIAQIIRDNEIDEVHIHQFPCILSVFPACLITNTPYIAYAHNTIDGVYEWFMTTFPIYEIAFPYYYKYASKIIAITEDIKQDIMKRFSIAEENILILKNSILFDEIDKMEITKVSRIKKFLMITRFSKEKGNSIYNGIDFFYEYVKSDIDATLNIIGDGELMQEVIEYVRDKELGKKVEFLGATNDVLKQINDADIILGLDRCILEAISMKRLAIILGYDDLKELITPENIEQASNCNFSGKNLKSNSKESLIKQLQKLSQEKIEQIVENNYKFAKEELNIDKNIYSIEDTLTKGTIFAKGLLEMFLQTKERLFKEIKQQEEELQQNEKCIYEQEEIIEKQKKEIEEQKIQIQKKQQEVADLNDKLSEICNSKRWRYVNKITNIFFH